MPPHNELTESDGCQAVLPLSYLLIDNHFKVGSSIRIPALPSSI